MEYPILKSVVPSVPDIQINLNKFSIGRSRNCSYVIASTQISRRHCQFEKINGEWTITDLSTNGLLVDRQKIEKNKPTKLIHGHIIILSEVYKFVFHFPAATASTSNNPISEDLIAFADAIRAEAELTEVTSAHAEAEPVEDLIPGAAGRLDNTQESTQPDRPEDAPSSSRIFNFTRTPPEPGDCAASTSCNSQNKSSDVKSLSKIMDDALEDEFHCSICTELFIKAITLNCSHTFCKFCITRWKSKNGMCPICRKKITSESPTIVLDSFISRIVQLNLTKKQRIRREKITELRERKVRKYESLSVVLDRIYNITVDENNRVVSAEHVIQGSDSEFWIENYSGNRAVPLDILQSIERELSDIADSIALDASRYV